MERVFRSIEQFLEWVERPRTGWLVLLLFCIALTLALRWRCAVFSPESAGWNETVDIHKYLHLAQNPLGSFHIQPTCWRIGVPFLVSLLPMDAYAGFDLLNVCFLALTGWMIYYWIRKMEQSPVMGLLGLLTFYALGSATKLILWGVASGDSGSYLAQVVILYAIAARRDVLFAVALLVGVSFKETVALAGPLYYTMRVQTLRPDWSLLWRSVVLGLPAMLVMLGIRLWIPSYNGDPAYVAQVGPHLSDVHTGVSEYTFAIGWTIVKEALGKTSAINILRMFTFGSIGIHFFLTVLGVRLKPDLLLRWSPVLVPTGLSLFAALNADRRMGSFFPFLIVCSLLAMRYLSERIRLSQEVFVLAMAVQWAALLLKRDVVILPADLALGLFLTVIGTALVTGRTAASTLQEPRQ